MKNNKVFIIVVILAAVLASTITAYATSYLYAANEVSYDNSNSGISATNVQGAINELYDTAQDYSSMNTRVSALEGRWTSDGNWFNINSTNSNERGLLIKDSSNVKRGVFSYSSSDATTWFGSYDSSGNYGQGTLRIAGKPIYISANIGGTGDINLNGNVKINGSLLSGTYNLGAITSGTLASNYSSFISTHKNESALEGKFYITSSTAPSDIPAATNEWKYSYGVFRVRYVDPSGISDGHIILYGWGTNRTAMKYVTNNTISSTWQYITPTN